MDPVLLGRIQFAMTVGFHFIFPPLTIGMAWLIVWFMGKYKNTGLDYYKKLTKFWFHLFAVSFAIGVATGITMEFQFGTNWSEYSRFVGDIFGAPLAAEGIFSFFLESTFMGILLFGWNRVSKKVLWISSLMVAIGSTMSGFWIIVANSWMQTPAGYKIVGSRAELTDFWAALFNPSTFPRFFHTIDGALMTGAFFITGVSAWYLLKGQHIKFAKESLRAALILAAISSVLQLGLGHYHAVQVAHTQPEKLAAIEGLYETQKCAPALLFGIPDHEEAKVHGDIRLPCMLSLLAYGDMDAEVKGLKEFPREHWPPIVLTFYPFHLMVGLGMFFILIGFIGLFLLWKKKLYTNTLFLKLLFFIIPLPFIANQLGWLTAEVGRQPWIVYRVMKTTDAISTNVPAGQVLASLIIFALLYSVLFFVWIYALRKIIKQGPGIDESDLSALDQEVQS